MIYCVEDDENIRELIVYTLHSTGFEARGFREGEDFFKALSEEMPELVLLDVMLPGEDGISILKKLRAAPAFGTLPVILVTAKGTEYDKVLGLELGADDYVAKPFGMMELISRVKAVLRRASPQKPETRLIIGSLELLLGARRVKAGGKEVALTYKEFELLRCLMESAGLVLTRDQLLERVWGYDFDGETRTVDVHVRTLRQKLGEEGRLIETVRGVGYRISRNA